MAALVSFGYLAAQIRDLPTRAGTTRVVGIDGPDGSAKTTQDPRAGTARRLRRLILVKHALPEIEPGRPRQEWRLSAEGRERCAALAEKLRPYAPARIFSSPEPKAHETALLVAAALDVPFAGTRDDLREHDDRDAPFQGEAAFRRTVREFFERRSERVFGPESAEAACLRFSAAADAICRPDEDGTLVVVAHGRVISLFVGRHERVDEYELWSRLGLPAFVVLDLPEYRVAEIHERV